MQSQIQNNILCLWDVVKHYFIINIITNNLHVTLTLKISSPSMVILLSVPLNLHWALWRVNVSVALHSCPRSDFSHLQLALFLSWLTRHRCFQSDGEPFPRDTTTVTSSKSGHVLLTSNVMVRVVFSSTVNSLPSPDGLMVNRTPGKTTRPIAVWELWRYVSNR